VPTARGAPATDRLTLEVVAVEEPLAGDAAQDEVDLPRQVVRILDRGVAAKAVGGRVPMRRVADEEDPPHAVFRRDQVVEVPRADLLDRDL
jgi:hypothetical protein